MEEAIAKISVESYDKSEKKLFDFDKSKSLQALINEIATLFSLPESKSYGLKCTPHSGTSFYVLNSNIKDIRTGDSLKLVLSIEAVVQSIFKLINCPETRSEAFNLIRSNCIDKAFIIELYNVNRINELLDIFLDEKLSPPENCACLLTIIHTFQLGYIANIDRDFLSKTLKIVKNQQHDSTNDEVEYSLSLLYHILVSKNENFRAWKEQIILSMSITQLIPYIRNESSATVQQIQYNALQLINAIIRSCKGEKRKQYIREMNLRQNRMTIYENVIKKKDIEAPMQYQLYVCQTLLLSLYKDSLKSSLNINDNGLFRREEFDLPCEDVDLRRSAILLDFDEDFNEKIPTHLANDNIPVSDAEIRYSLTSTMSDMMEEDNGSRNSMSFEESISYLTLEALRYFKKAHFKCFFQSQLEEKLYAPGIFVSSERVVRILAKLLHINRNPISNCTLYQPMVFFCPTKHPFFNELFARTMWLLSKTRREMKASTVSDFDKVMLVLEKEVEIVLATKPMDFKTLTQEMNSVSFEIVCGEWMVEKEKAFDKLVKFNPAVQQLVEKLKKHNVEVVNRQRMKVLTDGCRFPVVTDKKVDGNLTFAFKLSHNFQKITITNEEIQHYDVSEITHIIEGKNCPHAALLKQKQPQLAFSILLNHTNRINFVATTTSQADQWLDGLYILTGKDKRSSLYKEELNMLTDIDVRLQLMELENVPIPAQAPPVPKYPTNARPELPPKPKVLPKERRSKEIK